MKQIQIFFLFIALFSSYHLYASSDFLAGILYQNNSQWFLSVDDGQIGKQSIKKAQIVLSHVPEKYLHLLKEKSYLEIKGEQIKCPNKYICFKPTEIAPALLKPIK